MASYDFRSLSPLDFEAVVRDLLQREYNLRLESFKPGRDSGIDLRFAQDFLRSLIIQCKHFAASGNAKLMQHLKMEVPKVRRLQPRRYVVATSVGLTPGNKDEIRQLFHPFILAPGDILGLDDLNNLLGRHPEVERAHFKLWLASTAVLERVLHNSLFVQNNIERAAIEKKLRLYVESAALPRAIEILNDLNYCIISGVPGIGKSTLAEMLLIRLMMSGFALVTLRQNVNEGLTQFRDGSKQVFYYDDFLGRSVVGDKLGKNEDRNILRLIEAVRRSSEKKFILTTREYILAQAKQDHELLATSGFDERKCVVQLADYNKEKRAQILYNHLYHSDLPEEYIAALIENKQYLKLVNHRNYSPRIIEWMTDHIRVGALSPAEYSDLFLRTLDQPVQLWRHAYAQQIGETSRHLLQVIRSLPPRALLDDVRAAFDPLYEVRRRRCGFKTTSLDFENALDELEGNFLRIDRTNLGNMISFHNPSIADFIAQYLREQPTDLLEVVENAVHFEQVPAILSLLATSESGIIAPGLVTPLKDAVTRTIASTSTILEAVQDASGTAKFRRAVMSREDRLAGLVESAARFQPNAFTTDIDAMACRSLKEHPPEPLFAPSLLALVTAISKSAHIPSADAKQVSELAAGLASRAATAEWALEEFDAAVAIVYEHTDGDVGNYELLGAAFAEFLPEDVERNLSDFTRARQAEDYADDLERVADRLGFPVEGELERIRETASELDAQEEARYHMDDEWSGSSGTTDISDAEVAAMFETLRHRPG